MRPEPDEQANPTSRFTRALQSYLPRVEIPMVAMTHPSEYKPPASSLRSSDTSDAFVFSISLFWIAGHDFEYYRDATCGFVHQMQERYKRCRFVCHISSDLGNDVVRAIAVAARGRPVKIYRYT
jgi:hypothetical protein